jgi:pyruvate formate lyase activating enzyme
LADEPKAPRIVDIKRNSLDDGPGIRSVVFFKGCTLRCAWCQNPETLSPLPEIQRDEERCIACGTCTAVCQQGVARNTMEKEDSSKCILCGECVEACPTNARRIAGTKYSVEELADHLLKDEPFYRHSGGGVTLSGGEPAMYPAFVGKVAARLREKDVHVLMETGGQFDWEQFEEHLLPHVSTIYFDLKIADSIQHVKHIGTNNLRILENLERLVSIPFKDLLPRVPLIPGITDSEENLSGIAKLLDDMRQERVMLLPYNPLWLSKRRALGMEMPYSHDSFMSEEEIGRCRAVFEKAGIILAG